MPKPTQIDGVAYDVEGISDHDDAFVVHGLADASALNAEGDQWLELTSFGVIVHGGRMGHTLLPWHLISSVRLRPAKPEEAKKGVKVA